MLPVLYPVLCFNILTYLNLAHITLLIISIIAGFFISWVTIWAEAARNERRFKKIFKESEEAGLVKNFSRDEPPGVIYYTYNPQSKFRKEVKRLYYKLRGNPVDSSILTYDEKEDIVYKIILDAFSYLPGKDVVDRDFALSLIYFLACQYILLENNVPPRVQTKFRENFETSEYYDMISCFSDEQYCDENIILNPAYETTALRGLISEIILPLMRFSSERLHAENADWAAYRKKRLSLMELFEGMHRGWYRVLYVGRMQISEYIQLIDEKAEGRVRGFVIGASERNYSKLSTLVTFVNTILIEEWGKEWTYVSDEEGYDEEQDLSYHYMIFRRAREIKRVKEEDLDDLPF